MDTFFTGKEKTIKVGKIQKTKPQRSVVLAVISQNQFNQNIQAFSQYLTVQSEQQERFIERYILFQCHSGSYLC